MSSISTNPNNVKILNTMIEECGLNGHEDLINWAVTLLVEIVGEYRQGRQLGFYDERDNSVKIVGCEPFDRLRAKYGLHKQTKAGAAATTTEGAEHTPASEKRNEH